MRPSEIRFRLSRSELQSLNRSQIATGSQRHRDPRFLPYAFTEHGAIMAATVLNSDRATQVSVYVVRAFVRLREFLASHRHLARRLEAHENRLASHDRAIAGLVDTLDRLMGSREPRGRPIGFVIPDDRKRG